MHAPAKERHVVRTPRICLHGIFSSYQCGGGGTFRACVNSPRTRAYKRVNILLDVGPVRARTVSAPLVLPSDVIRLCRKGEAARRRADKKKKKKKVPLWGQRKN